MLNVGRIRCEHRYNPVPLGTKAPRFSWIVEKEGQNIMQETYQIKVAFDPEIKDIVWDSGIVSSDQSVLVPYEGPELKECTRYYYSVKISDNEKEESDWSEVQFFETGFFRENPWEGVFITADKDPDPEYDPAAPLFRKPFSLRPGIAWARLYVSGLGLFECYLNGQKVSDDVLAPGWTAYKKRVQYRVYDVADMLREGENALGAMVGVGWYKGTYGWGDKAINMYGDRTGILMQLEIRYADGTEETVVTDTSWKTTKGPILKSEIYDGEIYDATKEETGWDQPGFDDAAWAPVYELPVDMNTVVPTDGVPLKVIGTREPEQLIVTPKGETVFDFGQNITGWVEFSVSGKKGDQVIIKHAEILDADCNFYTENLREADAMIKYTLKGDGVETFRPHFTFMGFRFIQIVEYPGEIKLENFHGRLISSENEVTGKVECSNPLVSKLYENILWSQRGCFLDIPLDDPNRDERGGWLGDTHFFIKTSLYNMDCSAFYAKWFKEIAADQREDGGIPYWSPTFPRVNQETYNSHGWSDGAVQMPWQAYLFSGDQKILKDMYPVMKGWVDYIHSQARDGVFWDSGQHFGDWLGLDAREGSYVGSTPHDLISTCYYASDAKVVAKAAEILGYEEDAKNYAALFEDIVKAFNDEYLTPAGRIASDNQTSQILPMEFGMLNEKQQKMAIDKLSDLLYRVPPAAEEYFESYKYEIDCKLKTGFIGIGYLLNVLSDNGRNDLAYALIEREEYPSWLYQIKKGATTVWEHMDGIKPDGSLWSAGMNSMNQFTTGSFGSWLYRVMCGIRYDELNPGFRNAILHAIPGGNITWAKGEYTGEYGKIESGWKLEDGKVVYEVTIPANSTATVILPANAQTAGKPVGEEFTTEPCGDNEVSVNIGSGNYCFTYAC